MANEQFNPDFFLKVRGSGAILVVEIKQDGDDSNRNRAKLRDGRRHFETLNEHLAASGDSTRYHFKFLSPGDYPAFFEAVRNGSYPRWESSLMRELSRPSATR